MTIPAQSKEQAPNPWDVGEQPGNLPVVHPIGPGPLEQVTGGWHNRYEVAEGQRESRPLDRRQDGNIDDRGHEFRQEVWRTASIVIPRVAIALGIGGGILWACLRM